MKKYTDLLIDIDGTLTDTHEVERIALKKIFSDHNISLTESDIDNFSEINEKLWLEFEKGLVTKKKLRLKRFEIFTELLNLNLNAEVLACNYFDLYSKTVVPFDNVFDTINTLSADYKLHIISNGSIDVQYYKLSKLGIKDKFENIFLSEDIGYAKPNEKFFEYVYAHISQSDKSKILVVGDSLSADIIGGKSFGFDTLWISGIQNEYADYTVDSFYKITSILQE